MNRCRGQRSVGDFERGGLGAIQLSKREPLHTHAGGLKSPSPSLAVRNGPRMQDEAASGVREKDAGQGRQRFRADQWGPDSRCSDLPIERFSIHRRWESDDESSQWKLLGVMILGAVLGEFAASADLLSGGPAEGAPPRQNAPVVSSEVGGLSRRSGMTPVPSSQHHFEDLHSVGSSVKPTESPDR